MEAYISSLLDIKLSERIRSLTELLVKRPLEVSQPVLDLRVVACHGWINDLLLFGCLWKANHVCWLTQALPSFVLLADDFEKFVGIEFVAFFDQVIVLVQVD